MWDTKTIMEIQRILQEEKRRISRDYGDYKIDVEQEVYGILALDMVIDILNEMLEE